MSSNSHLNSSPLEPPKPSKLEQSPNHPQDLSANKSSTKKVLRFSAGPDDLQLVPKNETFMQRKLRKAREEALQAFAGAEFVKSYSKVEKERSSVNIHDKRKSDNFLESPAVIKINKPSGTPNNLSLSPNISDSSHLKIDESVNLTPFAARSPSPSNNNTSSGNRPEDVTPENKGNKKEISTAETAEKPINNDSGDKLSSLKTNLNSKFKEESFEAMLSTSKKKLPKIAEEKRLAKEREEQRRKEELKQMNSKDMIFKLDTCVLSQKKGSSL